MHDEAGAASRPEKALPGTRASVVRTFAFLNSLPRWLLKVPGSLSGFLHSILKLPKSRSDSTSCSDGSTWPMPIPFPEAFRTSTENLDAVAKKRLISMQVVVLSWLTLDRPSSCPSWLRIGMPLSSKQWSVVRMLEHLSFDGNTPNEIDAGAMGRAAAKFEGFEDSLAAVSRALASVHDFDSRYLGGSKQPHDVLPGGDKAALCGSVVGSVSYLPDPNAKPLVASRLNFPEEPRFDPRPYFDAGTLELYEKPLTLSKPLHEIEAAPRVKVRAKHDEKLKLYQKMAKSKMLRPLQDGKFLKDYRSGLFAVPKDSTRDRMVLDARGANIPDRGQSKWSKSMGSATSLAGLYISPDKIMIASGEDLKDFFYQFKVNDERLHRNVLQGDLSAGEARYVFGPSFNAGSGRTTVGLSTLAMGDCGAVEYAQCSHVGILLQNRVAKIEEMLTLRGSIPRGLLQIGVIVDDLIVLEQVLLSDFEDGSFSMKDTYASGVRLQNARKGYVAAGLENNPKKGFEAETCSSFWGIDLDGRKGLLRASQRRLWPAAVISLRVAMLGLSTVSLLESLAGVWVSLLGIRRRLYSAMDFIFAPLSLDAKPNDVVRLSKDIMSELCSLAVLGSLAVVNLRAAFADFVSATDSSSSVMAGVRASVPVGVTSEVSRHCLRKGLWSKLLPPGQALLREHGVLPREDEMPEDSFSYHPLWDVLARFPTYEEAWRQRIRRRVHINISELKAFVIEEKRIATSMSSLRYGSGLDSQVALGAVVKGRAASPHLNKVLRCSLAYPIGADLYALPMYYNTKFNRADGPTRDSIPQSPDIEKPGWWDELADGIADGFDEWLMRNKVYDAAQEIPFADVAGEQDLDLRPARRVKTERHKDRVQTKAKDEESKAADVVSAPLDTTQDRNVSCGGDAGRQRPKVAELLESLPKSQFFCKGSVPDFTKKGALDLFSGRYGVAKKLLEHGAPWVLTYEWNRSAAEDLLREDVRKVILELITLEAFSTVSAAPICSSFSVAVTPPVRSSKYPRGLPGLRATMRQKVSEGNSHNDFVYEVILLCDAGGLGYVVENPDTSFWWRQRKWKRWRSSTSNHVFRCCFCRFGTPWRKATRIATNTRLGGVRMMCRCNKPHVQLRGNHPVRKIPWTLVAQPYPTGLCRLLAVALCQHAGWCKHERLNVAGCSKTGSLRAGEASNPGPRRSGVSFRQGSLFETQILSAQTLALESRLLDQFLNWCSMQMPNTDVASLFELLPLFAVHALTTYAEVLYKSGGALSNLRHVILAVQRWNGAVKPFLGPAWEMVERWELLTPVKHRTPVPESLMQAMCVLAWNLEWYSWVGATLLAFYGAGRLGEVLRCNREDLVLPFDVLEQGADALFLRLRSFKSKMRQPAKIQHMKITDPAAVKLLIRIFTELDYDEPLFSSTPYQYRKRWDALLALLGVPKSCGVTPGGLRGGAAVYHYKKGKPIQDLLWLLRLRSVSTLESYLQEVAALNCFATLPHSVRRSVLSSASLFAFCYLATAFAG